MPTLRYVANHDVEKIIAIESESFPKPWDKEVFWILASCEGRMKLRGDRAIFMQVIDVDGEIAGYVVWEENNQDRAAHLMNIAIDSSFRRKGLATLLLVYLFDRIKSNGIQTCILEVRESNQAAIALYRSLGMKLTSRHLAYYGEEDALIYSIHF